MKQSKSSIRDWLLRFGLVLFGTFVALIILEVAVRQFLPPPYSEDNGNLWGCDRQLGWRGKQNTTQVVNTQGYVHEVVRNSVGMHDGEHQRQKPENVFRILVIGDSFVEARHVVEAETSHSVLEAYLNSQSSALQFEVISAGASAWGPAQALMYYRTEGKFFEPDLVLAYWYPANDLSDVLPDHRMTFNGVNCYAPYFVICEDGQADLTPWFSTPSVSPAYKNCSYGKKLWSHFLSNLYIRSRLFQQIEPFFVQNQAKIEYGFDFSPWVENNADDVLDYAYEVTQAIYRQLAEEVAQQGAQTGLVIVPLKQALYFELGEPYQSLLEEDYPGLRDKANPRLPNERIIQALQDDNILILDLQPAFSDHLKSGGGVLYWDVDSHWNVPGNRFAGERIAEWLIASQSVPIDQ